MSAEEQGHHGGGGGPLEPYAETVHEVVACSRLHAVDAGAAPAGDDSPEQVDGGHTRSGSRS